MCWLGVIEVTATLLQVSMVWAVSQASPLRRVVVDGILNLFECIPTPLISFIHTLSPRIQIQRRRCRGLRLRWLHG